MPCKQNWRARHKIFYPDSVSDIVVEPLEPALDGSQLTHTVVTLDGEMLASGALSALLIDVIGRPLSPGGTTDRRHESGYGTETRSRKIWMFRRKRKPVTESRMNSQERKQ